MSARLPESVARIGFLSVDGINHPSARFIRSLGANDLEGAVLIALERYDRSVTRSVAGHLERREGQQRLPNLERLTVYLVSKGEIHRAVALIENLFAYSNLKSEALALLAKQVALRDAKKAVEILGMIKKTFDDNPSQSNWTFLNNFREVVKAGRLREETRSSIFSTLVHKVDIIGARIIAESMSVLQQRQDALAALDDLVGGNQRED